MIFLGMTPQVVPIPYLNRIVREIVMDASIIDPIEHPNQHTEAHVNEHDKED